MPDLNAVKGKSKGEILHGKYPGRVLMNAVRRMMPKDSPLARQQLTCLRNGRRYAGVPPVITVLPFASVA